MFLVISEQIFQMNLYSLGFFCFGQLFLNGFSNFLLPGYWLSKSVVIEGFSKNVSMAIAYLNVL